MPVTKLIELNSGHTMPVVGLGTGKVIFVYLLKVSVLIQDS